MTQLDLAKIIRIVPDFPKSEISFYDIAPLLADADAWRAAILQMCEKAKQYRPEIIAGLDARGFLFAGAMALQMNCGAVMVRKKGKLPGDVIERNYSLEYGAGTLEVQRGIFRASARIVVVDDLLATGGTLSTACHLLRALGGEVCAAMAFIELDGLGGRELIDAPYENILKLKP